MNAIEIAVIVPASLLLLIGLVAAKRSKAWQSPLRDLVTGLAGLQSLLALLLTAVYFVDRSSVAKITQATGFQLIMLDGVSCLMFSLVAFVGWVICRYSLRYLDGEPDLGSYYRWTGFVIGAVSLMSVAGNLMIFIVAWSLSSLGLHHLLLFYKERPAAQRAAWTKFSVSRLGDLLLLTAAALIYREYQTLNFSELFQAADISVLPLKSTLILAIWLLIAGAAVKSAQVPFHTWLPQTLETPTPVSALMHAGIVNAGGYLVIRVSPLVQLAPGALICLALLGALTACVAALSMLTQNSVKKKLAYSTVAQMGFMMLQCGLGAFSAAMLHIVAHSLYKAYAFLNSGNLLQQREAMSQAPTQKLSQTMFRGRLLLSASAVLLLYLGSTSLSGMNPVTKPGGLLLGLVMCLALTHWVNLAWQSGSQAILRRTLAVSGLLCLSYCISFLLVDHMVAPQVPALVWNPATLLTWGVTLLIAAGFGCLTLISLKLAATTRPAWMNKVYLHALNGFYIESWIHQQLGNLAKR